MARSSAQVRGAIESMHKKHPKGAQTSNQLRAERANLTVARAAIAQTKAQVVSSIQSTTASVTAGAPLATAYSVKASVKAGNKLSIATRKQTSFRLKGARRALGVREATARLGLPTAPSKYKKSPGFKLSPHKITGIIRRVPRYISPSGYLTTTSWRQGRHMHHHPHHLVQRRHRRLIVKRWRQRRGVKRPR